MRTLITFVLCTMIGTECNGQHWRPLGKGVIGPGEVSTIFGDSVFDKLLLGGSFQRIINTSDTVLGIGIAAWNGSRWDSLAQRIQEEGINVVQKVYMFSRFNGVLHASGYFSLLDNLQPGNTRFAQLDEGLQRWERLACANPPLSGLSGLLPQVPQGPSIYATGFKGSLCGYPEASVFRYDGSAFYEWEPYALLPQTNNTYVGYVFEFQGWTYMTGSFLDPNGTPVTFLRWGLGSWHHVPGWGTMLANIKDFTIRDDKLYIIGTFRTDEGGPGNSIASYDGQNWNNLGGGLTLAQSPSSTVATRMEWFHDELYVCGQFDEAAGVYMDGIAKWNGVQWCSLPGNLEHPFLEFNIVDDFTVWRDSLFICGAFTMADGEECKHVAQWIGGDAVLNCSSPVSVPEQQNTNALAIHPNPARDQTSFTSQEPMQVFVFDALSRQVWQGRVQGRVPIDISAWEPGTYFVRHGTGTSKLVVVR